MSATPVAMARAREVEQDLLEWAGSNLRVGDIMLFYHRTSARSRWIRRVTGCSLPHVCIVSHELTVVGMLKGRVHCHPVQRFFRSGYDVCVVRGSPAVHEAVVRHVESREAWVDLLVIGLLTLFRRMTTLDFRNQLRYRMRGVTCSGVVSDALHRAYSIEPIHSPLQDTPRDVEELIRELRLSELLRVRLGA